MLEGFNASPLTRHGGKYNLVGNPYEVPLGSAIDCQDVDFLAGRVFTRAGLTNKATLTGRVVALDEYVQNDASVRTMLAFTDAGTLYGEPGNYSFASIATNIAEASVQPTLRMVSTTLFGRQYMAFSTKGIYGAAVPQFYDGTNVFRVSTDAPGGIVNVVDGGAGNISTGVHQVRVFAKTTSGYWTALGPAQSWTAAGGLTASVTNIPTGPSNWAGRVLAFTPTCSPDYYFIDGGAMVLNDNSTTSATVDFTDDALIAGTAVSSSINVDQDQQAQIVLPAQAFVANYNRRLVWTGERNVLLKNGDLGFPNLNMDGGVSPANPAVPGGWTLRAAGGNVVAKSGATGTVLSVLGDGISQKGVLENQGQANLVVEPGVQINVRVRCMIDSGSTGTYHVWFRTSASGLTPSADSLAIDLSTLSSTEWRIVDGQCLSAANNSLSSTHTITIGSGDGITGSIINNNGKIYIDYIEPYVGGQARNGAIARWSKVDDPEAYDGNTGFQVVGKDDGQDLSGGFLMNKSFYYVKTRSMYRTYDNGSTEPNEWTTELTSKTVGSPSSRGFVVGEGWALIAARAGLYFFDGSSFTNISYEIKKDWQRINWTNGYQVFVALDIEEKRIYVGAPLDGADFCNAILYCRYLGDTPINANDPEVPAHGVRDWAVWTSKSLCAGFSERSNGTRVLLVGSSDSSGQVGQVDSTVATDYGAAIPAYYQTAYFAPADLPAMYGGSSSRNLFGYLTMNLTGSGVTLITGYGVDNSTVLQIPPFVIEKNPFNSDLEWLTQISTERLSIRVASSGVGANFSIQKIMPYMRTHPWTAVRGTKQ